MDLPFIEPFKTKMVEPIFLSTKKERELWIDKASYNLFNLRSDQVIIDLLTDSGTGAMSENQWAALMLGDESYAGATSFYELKKAVKEITGFDWVLPAHQGRAAENVLFSVLVKEGDLVPGNSHFDTTKGHIEFRKAIPVDCTIEESLDFKSQYPFKGNVDLEKLEKVLKNNPVEKIPVIIVTITNNTAGGQPVSMENIKGVRKLADKYGTRFFMDSARFAENAWFIKTREKGYSDKSIREIALEMFSYADGITMSSKKDAIVNMGGFTAFHEEEIYREASVFNIIYEGFLTYGGMSGRDMGALACGLYEGTDENYLRARTGQVAYLGNRLKDYGVPVLEPFGGHAVFIDSRSFLSHVPLKEFPAQTLVAELYIEGGIRSAEIGTLMADRDPVTHENRSIGKEFVRLAVPRRVYSNSHMDYVASTVKNVFDRRDKITKGLFIVNEAPILRHFTIKLDRLK
jgi:tryptophanase